MKDQFTNLEEKTPPVNNEYIVKIENPNTKPREQKAFWTKDGFILKTSTLQDNEFITSWKPLNI